MSALKKRIAGLEAHFTGWLETEARRHGDLGVILTSTFVRHSWSDIVAMAVLAPASEVECVTDEQRKCRIAALLVEAYKRKVAAEARN
jgi:hypothetical protein